METPLGADVRSPPGGAVSPEVVPAVRPEVVPAVTVLEVDTSSDAPGLAVFAAVLVVNRFVVGSEDVDAVFIDEVVVLVVIDGVVAFVEVVVDAVDATVVVVAVVVLFAFRLLGVVVGRKIEMYVNIAFYFIV